MREGKLAYLLAIGLEIAKALFARPTPYHIMVGCRGNISRAREAVSTLEQLCPESPSKAEPLLIDISSDDSILTAFECVKGKHGRLDAIINNAGNSFRHSLSRSLVVLK